jgi:hypothetical protein
MRDYKKDYKKDYTKDYKKRYKRDDVARVYVLYATNIRS